MTSAIKALRERLFELDAARAKWSETMSKIALNNNDGWYRLQQHIPDMMILIREQDRLLKLAREALEFYANVDNYYAAAEVINGRIVPLENEPITDDDGKIARKALSELQEAL